MSKTNYNVYEIKSKVFGISRNYKDGNPTDSVCIYDAIVDGVSIDYDEKTNKNKITYMLKTPNGEFWGDSINEDEVSDSFEELAYKMKDEWSKNSNTF